MTHRWIHKLIVIFFFQTVNTWTGNVVENCLSVLTKQQKPYKYIVTCLIMQKNGAGLHTASSCFWNNDTDGSCTVRYARVLDMLA